MMRVHRGARARKGTAAVELAVVMMPLMFIVIGMLEGGRLMMAEELLSNAAREGARLASLGGSAMGTSTSTGSNEVNYRVRQYLTASAITASAATITTTDLDRTITDLSQAAAGDRIQVTITISFSNVSWIKPWFFKGATLTGTSVMRKESP